MGAFGTKPFGTSSFGGSADGIGIALAWPTSTNSVHVRLTSEPKHGSGYVAGDALNPSTWSLIRVDTGAIFTILGVRDVDPPLDYEIVTLEPLADWTRTHRVASSVLLSASGVLITAPSHFDFPGTIDGELATAEVRTSGRRFTTKDLSNPPNPVGSNSVAGHLVIGSNGDYQLDQGAAFVRKLLLRRLVTRKGAFYHLPNYGVGLLVKEPIPSSMLSLKRDIESQMLEEPDVERVEANISLQSGNVLVVQLRAMTKNGQEVSLGVKSSRGGFSEL